MAKTLEFKSERNWDKVLDALYETDIHFASYGYKAITIFDDEKAEAVMDACKEHRIAVKEI